MCKVEFRFNNEGFASKFVIRFTFYLFTLLFELKYCINPLIIRKEFRSLVELETEIDFKRRY